MNYKLIGKNNYQGNLKEEYFKNRGITKYKEFMNLSKHKLTEPLAFLNMDKAVDKFVEHMDLSVIGLIVDEDVDGVTSSSILYRFISENLDNEIEYIIHKKNKAHGINLDDFSDEQLDKIDLLIVADAGSFDFNQQKELFEQHNIETIVLDHHSPEEDDIFYEKSIIVNNNVCNISENLTGSAMAYMFVLAVSKYLGIKSTIKEKKYLDLAMMGLVGDSADTSDLDVQYLIQKGLNNIQSEMIQEMISKEDYSLKGVVNQESFGWYLCPNVNAVIRYGDYEQRKLLFEAFSDVGTDREFEYTATRGKNKGVTIYENLYEHVCRFASSLKGKQKREIDKIINGNTRVKGISEDIKVSDETKVIVFDATDVLEDGELTGLLANKVMSKYNLPTIILRKRNDKYSGSGRGELIENFKTKLNGMNLFEAKGHEPAFGIKPFEKKDLTIKELSDKINLGLKDEKLERTKSVDFIIPHNELEDYMIEELYETKDYWGQGMESPMILIEGLEVKTDSISIVGSKSNTMIFDSNFIKYVKFRLSEDEREKLIPWEDSLIYNIIGKPSINEFEGERHMQIIIDEIELVSSSKEQEDNYDWSDDSFEENDEW